MSSWRNLMTPLYEKHYLKDSSNSSSMSQSNFAKISTLQMKESIGYSDKLKDLQSQMSRLKGELTKYSTRDKNPKKSGRARNEFSSPEKASESYFGITAQIQEESSLLHDADKLDILEEDTILASPELTKKRRSKGRIVRNSLRNANAYDSPYAKPNRSELLSMNRTRETETSLYDDNQAKTYMGPVTEVMRDMEYENKLTTQKLRKRGSHRERHDTEPEESGTLKNALAECCLEINNLKQVVLDSQDQIKFLCEELSKEKKKSNELREELQQCSVVLSNRKHNTTFAGTPLRKEINTGTKQFSQDVKRQILWSNRQRDQIQAERNSHVTCKGFDDYGRIEADVEEFKLAAIRPRREESSSKDFSRSRHEYKEIAVQCDFMLDGIMDSHEEEIEEQKEEINKLKAELNTVKNHKNDLIESFQQIVGLLTAPDTTKAKALQDTQNIFSDYYNAINAKMGEFQQAPTRNFNSSKKSSKFNGMTSNYMGKSRHNRTEISDNLMYSPSNTAISFDNELMESRLNTLVNSLKFGSQLNNY